MKMRHIMSKVKQKQASGKVIPIYHFLLNFPLYDSLHRRKLFKKLVDSSCNSQKYFTSKEFHQQSHFSKNVLDSHDS